MSHREIIEQYYRRHRGELLRFVSSRLGGDAMAAEDLVQELFLRLLADERRPLAETTLPSLVHTMALHLVADHYRRHRQQQRYEQLACHDAADELLPAVFARDTIAHIERRLNAMPTDSAVVYRLHLYGGMKTADICQHLGIAYKTAEYRLGQARREVRRLLSSS